MPTPRAHVIVAAMMVWRGDVAAAWSTLGGLAVAIMLSASPAVAQSVALSTVVEDSARASCPSDAAIDERLRAYLAESEGVETLSVTLRVRHDVGPTAPAFRAIITLRRGELESERRLAGATCAASIEAAILVIAIAADPGVLGRPAPAGELSAEGSAETSPDGTTSSSTGAEPITIGLAEGDDGADVAHDAVASTEVDVASIEAAEAPASSEATASRLSGGWAPPSPRPTTWLIARAAPALGVGMLPAPAPGLAVDIGVRIEIVELALGAVWLADSGAALNATSGGTIGLVEGSFRVGIAVDLAPVELVPQLRLGIGAISGRGYGSSRDARGDALWLEVAGGLDARLRFAVASGLDLGLFVSGELVVPVTRPSFVILAGGTVFTPSEVGGLFALGVVLWVG